MLTFIQNSWHYILALLAMILVAIICILGHIVGTDAVAIIVALAGGGLISGSAQNSAATVTVPTNTAEVKSLPVPSPETSTQA